MRRLGSVMDIANAALFFGRIGERVAIGLNNDLWVVVHLMIAGRVGAEMKFIFEVHIKPNHTAEQYASAWLRASEILQRAPGARGTRLHCKIGNPNILLAIASWESKAARDAMEERNDETVRRILREASQHSDIVVIGEFDEPEWVVDPQ